MKSITKIIIASTLLLFSIGNTLLANPKSLIENQISDSLLNVKIEAIEKIMNTIERSILILNTKKIILLKHWILRIEFIQ